MELQQYYRELQLSELEERRERLITYRAQHVKDKKFKEILSGVDNAIKKLKMSMGERVAGMHKIGKGGTGVDSFFGMVKNTIAEKVDAAKTGVKTRSVFDDR